MKELKSCPFCGENKAKLIRMNEETQEEVVVDADELDNEKIFAYVLCYGRGINFSTDFAETPRKVIELWNGRTCMCRKKEN